MFVYSVSYLDKIDSLFKNGFSRQFLASNEGTDYGDGVYCNINIEDSLNRWNNVRHIGGCILKLEIVGGLDRYLIFNSHLANETYGECSIKNQVYSLFGEDADKVWRDFTNIMKYDVDARKHFSGRTAELLQVLLSPRRKDKLQNILPPEDRRRNIRAEYENLFKKHNIRGAIYRGMKDGLCLVAYDFGDCRPFEYSVDGGRTWKRKEYNGATVDVHKKYALKYRRIDYPIRLNFDDEIYEFSRVQKKNGKYNYIDIQTGEEISPVDFDSVTLMNPDTGDFDIEYKGKFYIACVQGFFLNQNEYDMGEGHTFDELLNINENMNNDLEKKFDEILESVLNETLKLFTDGKKVINESESIDEAKYLDYEIPTLEELDNDETISLYHICPSSVIDSIFTFACDREFTGKNANAYGAGVYTTPTVEQSRTLIGPIYGDAMVHFKLIGGFDRFLMFEENYAIKYYGEHHTILDQLKTMFPSNIAHQLYNKCYDNVKLYAKFAGEYNIRGAIYKWGGVTAILPFDFSSLIPYAVSYDKGKTFEKKIDASNIDRVTSSIDVTYRYGHLFKRIDKAMPGYNENDELTGFARVQKKNGKYNFIDIQTGKEISPVDFDSATLMDSDTGDFDIEYKGKFYVACVQGFFLNKTEYDMGEGHTFDELANL